MPTLEQWEQGLRGEIKLDSNEFVDFIPRDGNPEFLDRAFGGLPAGHALIRKISALLKENNNSGLYVLPKIENYKSFDDIKRNANLYADNVRWYLRSIDRADLVDQIDMTNITVVKTQAEFIDMTGGEGFEYSDGEEEVNYQFIDYLDKYARYAYALEEACLFLTKYPGITRYLMEDVVSFPLRHQPYYELWKAGGDVHFFQGVTLLQCPYGEQ